MANWTADQQREHRKLWVEALRSGKYRQTTGRLRNNDGGMCCLGVACEISGLTTWGEIEDVKYSPGFRPVINGESRGRFYAPPEVADWLGLADDHGKYGEHNLADDNDNGTTFARIADIIESEPDGLIADKAA